MRRTTPRLRCSRLRCFCFFFLAAGRRQNVSLHTYRQERTGSVTRREREGRSCLLANARPAVEEGMSCAAPASLACTSSRSSSSSSRSLLRRHGAGMDRRRRTRMPTSLSLHRTPHALRYATLRQGCAVLRAAPRGPRGPCRWRRYRSQWPAAPCGPGCCGRQTRTRAWPCCRTPGPSPAS